MEQIHPQHPNDMKTTDHFKRTIQAYLEQRAEYDILFAHAYRNPNKSLDGCITFILNQVRKSGCTGFTDDEIFSYGLHYFDESEVEIGEPINCNVVVNHTVELTSEEVEQARRDAIQRVQNEAYAQMKQRTAPKKAQVQQPQAILFDF